MTSNLWKIELQKGRERKRKGGREVRDICFFMLVILCNELPVVYMFILPFPLPVNLHFFPPKAVCLCVCVCERTLTFPTQGLHWCR